MYTTIIDGQLALCEKDEDGQVHVLQKPFWKTPFNHDTNAESDLATTPFEDEHLTDQSFKDEVDINQIVQRAIRGQQVLVPPPEAYGADLTKPLTWQQINDIWAENAANFYRLDPELRGEFLNQPARWMDAAKRAMDKGDLEECRRIGISLDDLKVIKPNAPGDSSPGARGGGGDTPGSAAAPPKGGQEASS